MNNRTIKPILATIVVILGWHVAFFPEVAFSQGEGAPQAECGFVGTRTSEATQRGGQWMTARDTLHVLVVFVQFPDDRYDTTYSLWPTYPSAGIYPGPTYLNTYIDSVVSQMSTNGNLSHYFRDMSMGALKLTGKTRFMVTPHTRQWYLGNGWCRWLINKEILESLDATLDFAEFDRWRRYGEYDIRRESDGWVDMVFMIYRHVENASALGFHGGEASLGYIWQCGGPSEFYVDSGQRRIGHGHPVFGHPGAGTTSEIGGRGDGWFGKPPYRVQIHELAHHWMTNGDWYGHNGRGFWGMLNDWGVRQNSLNQCPPNSYERELLGWHAPDSIYQNTLNVTLTDYVTTNRSVKIRIPGNNPNEFFRLEYHLKMSQFDNPEVHEPNAKGLYIIHQTGNTNPFTQLKHMPAHGRWIWTSNEVVYPSYYPRGLAVYRYSHVDRVNGYDYARGTLFTWTGPPPTPNVPNPSEIHFYRDRLTNQLIEKTIFLGNGEDAYGIAKNNPITPWSNPNTQNSAKRKTWISIEIINENAQNGTITFNVYFDSASAISLPPSKPQDLRVVSVTVRSTSLRWARNLEPDLVRYRVYRGIVYAGSGEPSYTLIGTVNAPDTTYIDNNYEPITLSLPQNIDLYNRYRITAVDNQGKESVKSDYVDAYFAYVITSAANGGCNMLSVPVEVRDFARTAVWPTSSSHALWYQPGVGYVRRDTLQNGPGYWIAFPSRQPIPYGGYRINNLSMGVQSGWNMVGSITYPVPTNRVCSSPSRIISTPFYEYTARGGYTPVNTLMPGKGYWVKVNQNGTIMLRRDGVPCDEDQPIVAEMDQFTVTDAEGKQQVLYVANAERDPAAAQIDGSMPPRPPRFCLEFGAWFDSEKVIEVVNPEDGTVDLNIVIDTETPPVTLTWNINPENAITYSFPDSGSGFGKRTTINGMGSLTLSLGSGVIRLTARASSSKGQAAPPTEYSLMQNYPNPFNPATKIKYGLPFDSYVSIKVFDVLGRAVATLADHNQRAGWYEVNFDASGLSSGVYFYRMTAGNFTQTRKLLLMK